MTLPVAAHSPPALGDAIRVLTAIRAQRFARGVVFACQSI